MDEAKPTGATSLRIVQIGQDRAGFYSYTQLEKILGKRLSTCLPRLPPWE